MNTIAAISTPPGTGGLAVIRISGNEAVNILGRIFLPASGKKVKELKSHTTVYGNIYDGEEKIDDGMATFFYSPNSYTGETIAEISCHGGSFVTKRVLSACINAGAKPALPGEFTKRAVLNGKMTLTQAESVIYIIEAQSRQYLSYSINQREGALYKKIMHIRKIIFDITVQIAAWIDFSEEGLDDFEITSQLGQITECGLQLKLLLESYDIGKVLRDGIITAIIGKPNVGKSTIMNLLVGNERSIVTDIAGTTRDIVEEYVNIGDVSLRLSDCAGLRDAGDEVEKIGVERMLKRLEESELVLAVFDNSRPLEKEDYIILEKIKDKPKVCIINKIDLENQLDLTFLATKFNSVIEIEARKSDYLEHLNGAIQKVLQLSRIDMSAGFIANERQRQCAIQAEKAISNAIESIRKGITLDATGVILEEALVHLAELSGENVSDEIIDEVFNRFCVGK
ncbi:MAG: tRNA uridine-5-carboxymethylaminomethyl(34) synthesis GTPase MnmE [Eubacterium sp.]|jgi:tRNA modification GTPase|nr:tRNA uridine-5-carboxymethylaminomethyl(34) synthesis GTPase MnmE [Eubacterium sp.]